MSGYVREDRGRTGDENGGCHRGGGEGSGGRGGWKFLPLIGGLGSSRAETTIKNMQPAQPEEEKSDVR